MRQNLQTIKWSKKFGGERVVLTGSATGVTAGAYKVDLDTLPDGNVGCVPAGTPIYIDDAGRTIAFHYAFEVVDTTNVTTSGKATFDIKVAKGFEGTRAQVLAGANAMILGVVSATDATAAVTRYYTVTGIDRTNAAYDVLTLANTSTDTTAIAPGTILVEVKATDNNYYVKVKPNGITFYDVSKDDRAVAMLGVDGLFSQVDGVVLTNRIPPIAPAIRQYMRDNDVYLRYSVSQE